MSGHGEGSARDRFADECAVGIEPLFRDHAEGRSGEQLRQRRERRVEHDDELGRVGGDDAGDGCAPPRHEVGVALDAGELHCRQFGHAARRDALERELHISARDRPAIRELRVRREGEGPRQPVVAHRPRRGDGRREFAGDCSPSARGRRRACRAQAARRSRLRSPSQDRVCRRPTVPASTCRRRGISLSTAVTRLAVTFGSASCPPGREHPASSRHEPAKIAHCRRPGRKRRNRTNNHRHDWETDRAQAL